MSEDGIATPLTTPAIDSWTCPACDGPTSRKFLVREHRIRECGACRHRFVEWRPPPGHVSNIYGDDYFFGGGAGYPDYLSERDILFRHGARYADALSRYMKPGLMLDVGAACGFISAGFRSQGWDVEALEPNRTMAAWGRKELELLFHTGALEDLDVRREYDLVTMIQVFAHFADLQSALKKAAQSTREGGFWLIETWDSRSLTARLFGKHWHEYNPPGTLHYFSRVSLRRIAGRFGFRLLASGRPRKYIKWSHARSLISHQIPSTQLRRLMGIIPDNMVLPYPAEDLFWMLFQKTGGV